MRPGFSGLPSDLTAGSSGVVVPEVGVELPAIYYGLYLADSTFQGMPEMPALARPGGFGAFQKFSCFEATDCPLLSCFG